MNINQSIFSMFLTTAVMATFGQSTITGFEKLQQEETLQAFVDFLHENRSNSELCKTIIFELTVKKKGGATSANIASYVENLTNIIHQCNNCQQSTDMQWVKNFGFPIKDIMDVKGDVRTTGIEGTFDISLDTEKDTGEVIFRLSITRQDNYNTEIWLKIFDIALRSIEIMERATRESNPCEILKDFGYPLNTFFNSKDFETSARITFEDSTSLSLYACIGNT